MRSVEHHGVENRPAPWHVVALGTLLAIVLGIGGATIAQRSAHHTASVSLGFLAAARAKTGKVNNFRVSMTVKIKVSGHHLTEQLLGELGQHPFRMSLGAELPGGLGRMDERAVGRTLYMRLARTDINGKHWIAYTLPARSTTRVGVSDPLGMLRTLTGATGSVVRAGTKTIDGVKTTRYKATLRPKAVVGQLPSDLRQSLGASSGVLNSIGSIPVEVYIAGDNTVRRVTEKLSFGGVTATIELNLTPLGHPARVVAPPAGDVVRAKTMSELFQDLRLPAGVG